MSINSISIYVCVVKLIIIRVRSPTYRGIVLFLSSEDRQILVRQGRLLPLDIRRNDRKSDAALKIVHIPMSLSRATALTRPVLRRCFTTTLAHKPLVNTPLKSRSRFLSTRAAEDDGGFSRKMQEVLCRVRGTVNYFNLWTILRKVGVPYCMIIQFRRKMKKIYYVTGLSTVMRAAFPIIVGDLLAQTVYPLLFEKKSKKRTKEKDLNAKSKQLSEDLKKNAKEINWCRTSHFALIGGFFVGPFAKRWNLFWGRRIRRYPPGAYLSRVLILDALLLTPFIVSAYMAGYDWKYIKDHVIKEDKKNPQKLQDKLRKRYETPFTDMCLFYITTKPIVALMACFVLPCGMRNSARKLYSFVFYCFVSHTITHFKLGEEITQRKKKHGKKGNHYDASGGFVCMALDKIHDLFKRDKK